MCDLGMTHNHEYRSHQNIGMGIALILHGCPLQVRTYWLEGKKITKFAPYPPLRHLKRTFLRIMGRITCKRFRKCPGFFVTLQIHVLE